MTALTHDPVLGLAVRLGLALLFASAAWHKLRDRAAFAGVLEAYRLLPAGLVVPAATILIAAVELGVALALLVPGGHALGVVGVVTLLTGYSIAIAINLARGRRTIDCGCGAPGTRQPISEWLVVRNAGLALLALLTVRPVVARPLLWVDWLTLAGTVAVAACAWTAAHGLAAAFHRTSQVGAAR